MMYLIKCHEEDCLETNIHGSKECPQCLSKDVTASRPTAQDYVIAWEGDLENNNRHSAVDMPAEIYETLKRHIKDDGVVLKIVRDFYVSGIGV